MMSFSRRELLTQARDALSRGNALEASQRCARLLLLDPNDPDALGMSGKTKAALGKWREAAGDLRRALAVRPRFVPAMIDLGMVFALSGQYREAEDLLENALTLDPRLGEPHFGLGVCRMESGELIAAEQQFRLALARNPQLIDAQNNLGVVLDRQGKLAEAAEEFRRAMILRPDYLKARLNLADVLMRLGRAADAVTALQAATALCPADARLLATLGAAQLAAGDFAAAALSLEHALTLDMGLTAAAANFGEALRQLDKLDRAAAAYRHALSRDPNLAEAHLGLAKIEAARGERASATAHALRAVASRPSDVDIGTEAAETLERLGARQQALGVLLDLARIHPGDRRVHDAGGELLYALGHYEAAAASFERALSIEPERADLLLRLGSALESLGRYGDAMQRIELARRLRPGEAEGAAALLSCAIRVCDWDRTEHALEQLRSLPLGIDSVHPFLLLTTDWSAEEQSESLKRRGRGFGGMAAAQVVRRYTHERLRVAYLSPDFREHPVAHALAGVIERHDRGRFTPIAISLTAGDQSSIGARLSGAFDEFIDASSMSDADIAELCREREIDVAVDLAGHTVGSRPALFAARIAPLQVNYLGYPSSSGLESMDAIIADDSVVPQEDADLYTERVLRMPNSYLPFDCSRQTPEPLERGAAGLPADGFVFCAFNTAYKITRAQFALWLGLLRDTPGSVLWLRQMGAEAATNLRLAAAAHGIAEGRLIFAPYLGDLTEHVARLSLADLFLDTTPYNAHTSAAEALWAGVPVVTCMGRTFAGRVGASLLRAAGLPQLIAADIEGYRRLALELARAPARLRDLRRHLAESRSANPLFDTERYTRDFERLLMNAAHDGEAMSPS